MAPAITTVIIVVLVLAATAVRAAYKVGYARGDFDRALARAKEDAAEVVRGHLTAPMSPLWGSLNDFPAPSWVPHYWLPHYADTPAVVEGRADG